MVKTKLKVAKFGCNWVIYPKTSNLDPWVYGPFSSWREAFDMAFKTVSFLRSNGQR